MLRAAATAKEPVSSDSRRRELAVAPLDPFEIADMVSGESVDTAKKGRASLEASRAVGFEHSDTTTGEPRSKMAKVTDNSESIDSIQRFESIDSTLQPRIERKLRSVREQTLEAFPPTGHHLAPTFSAG